MPMEDNNTQPQVQDQSQAQPQPLPQQTQAPKPHEQAIRGERVLQPIDANVVPETPAPHPIVRPRTGSPMQPQVQSITSSETGPDFSTIYPTPETIGRPHQLPTLNEKQAKQEPPAPSNPLINTGITVIGSLIIAVSGLILLATIFFITSPGGFLLAFAFIPVVFQMCLGIGILRKKETARIIFVVLAIISLVGSTLGLVRSIYAANTAQTATHTESKSLDSRLGQCRNDTNASLNQRQSCANQIKKEQDTIEQDTPMGGFVLIALINYTIAIVPPFFLTRPSVKAQFR